MHFVSNVGKRFLLHIICNINGPDQCVTCVVCVFVCVCIQEELSEALTEILSSIKLQERGVFVQASTLGSLEALLDFLRTSKIPVSTQFIPQKFTLRV